MVVSVGQPARRVWRSSYPVVPPRDDETQSSPVDRVFLRVIVLPVAVLPHSCNYNYNYSDCRQAVA